MMTQTMSGWGARGKRTSLIALGLVAILAGIAVAYFLTSREFAGNQAVGGALTVDATLPMDFTDEPLYPTAEDPAPPFPPSLDPPESNFSYAEKEFSIDNNNTVKVTYQLFATCEECIADPADTPEQAAARADKVDQFNNLWVQITGGPTTYKGKLADLSPTSPHNLGEIEDGSSTTYTVRLWLQNDPSRAQPQGVQNIWEFFVNAKTPA